MNMTRFESMGVYLPEREVTTKELVESMETQPMFDIEKLTGIKVLFLVVGMAIFEIIGIASIMPFLAILGDQDMIYENEYLALMYDFSRTIGVISTNDFLIFLGMGSFSLIIISAVYRTITQ